MAIGSAIASIAGGVMSASASSKAADAQVDAAQDALDLQEEMYDTGMDMIQPFYGAGVAGLDPYMNSLGLYRSDPGLTIEYVNGGAGEGSGTDGLGVMGSGGVGLADQAKKQWQKYLFNQDFEISDLEQAQLDEMNGGTGSGGGGYYSVNGNEFGSYEDAQAYVNSQSTWENRGFEATPGYQYNVDQMEESVGRSASAGGRSLSGETLKELQYNAKGLANQEYGNYQNALAGLVGMGTGTAGQAMNAGQNYANAASNLYTNMGQARASGYEGQASAFNNTLGNLSSAYMYNQMGMFG